MLRVLMVASAITLCVTLPATGYTNTSKQLAEPCRSANEWKSGRPIPTAAWACRAYLEGFTDAYIVFVHGAKAQKPFCTPGKSTWQQLSAVFVRWFDRNPKHWHESTASNIHKALLDAFPCK